MAGILEGTGIVEEVTYSTFGCNAFKEDPATPDRLTPNVAIKRRGAESFDLNTPDGKKIKIWGFVDSALPLAQQVKVYPSPTIRVRQGQIVHTTLTTSKGPHTIHHHGIEPTTANDGVGHVSFEVGDHPIPISGSRGMPARSSITATATPSSISKWGCSVC